jgi:hypothetical protein
MLRKSKWERFSGHVWLGSQQESRASAGNMDLGRGLRILRSRTSCKLNQVNLFQFRKSRPLTGGYWAHNSASQGFISVHSLTTSCASLASHPPSFVFFSSERTGLQDYRARAKVELMRARGAERPSRVRGENR